MFSDFVINDPRKDRATVTVTEESLTNRCKVMLPPDLIKDKHILDVGCANGAMGRWALEYGAGLYDGVEIQKEYRETAKYLLRQYRNANIYRYLGNTNDSYDIVIAAGVLHGKFDLIETLRKICSKSREYLILETHFIDGDVPLIEIRNGSMINYHDVNKPFTGMELAPNRPAIDTLMAVNGFILDKDLQPEPILGSHDAYNAETGNRFIARYKRTNNRLITLEESIYVGV